MSKYSLNFATFAFVKVKFSFKAMTHTEWAGRNRYENDYKILEQ